MENRKAVTRAELDEWLTQEICKVEDCDGSRLAVQYLLVEPDANGCNWSGVIAHVGPNTTADAIQPIASRIVDRARSKFNLIE